MRRFLLLLPLCAMLAGCYVSTRLEPAPAMVKRAGKAPTLALVTWSGEKSEDLAGYSRKKLGTCLADRNIFKLASSSAVNKAVKASGADLGSLMGPSRDEFKQIAKDTGADYVLFGAISVLRHLKLTGFRKDIQSGFYLHDAAGKRVDFWRSDTSMSAASADEELTLRAMADGALNHTCAKIVKDFP